MQTQSWLFVILILIVLAVIGIIVFLPTSSPQPQVLLTDQPNSIDSSLPTPSSIQGTDTIPNTENSLTTKIGEGNENPPNNTGIGNALPDIDTIASATIASTQSSGNAAVTAENPQSFKGISGVVKNTQRKPIQGAAIQVGEASLLITDSQGIFKVEKISQESVTVTAQLAGYQTLQRENVPTGTANLELILIPEGMATGKVLDQFGDPIALAQVQAKALQGVWAVEISADAEGCFMLSDIPNNRVRFQATQEGFTDSGAGNRELDLPSNEEIVLRLNRPTFTISGRVLAQENKQGIENFQLKAVLQDTGSIPEEKTAQTDGTGLYRFDQLRQGTYIVSSLAKENAHTNYVIPLIHDAKSVRLFEKSASNIDFIAVVGRTVSGMIMTSNNQSVANAEVTIASLQSVQTRSNSNGQFRLTGVPITGGQTMNRLEIRLQATHSDYGTGLSDPLPTDAEAEISGVQITLQGLSTLTGKAIDGDDVPVADARIILRDLSLGEVQETRTNPSGEFTFSQVASAQNALQTFGGTHEITGEKENYSTVCEQVLLQPGQAQNLTLTMELGGVIQGRVLDPNNQPLSGVHVSTPLPRGGMASAASDSYGLYTLTGLPAGAYDLSFRVDSDPPLTGVLYQIASGSTQADITLSQGKWDLMGTVFDGQSGERIFQYMLSIEGTPKDPRGKPFVMNRSINTPDGTYHVTFTEPGIYRIRFLASDYHPLEENADISATTLRLQYINPQLQPLVTTGRIQGTFALPEGIALVGINIPGVQGYPLGGNIFELNDIPSGNHDLIFHGFDQSSYAVFEMGVLLNVSVSANQTTDLGQIGPQSLTTRSRNF